MDGKKDINRVVKVITYSLILVFKFRDRRISSRKMQIFFSSCHFLRLVRQYLVTSNAFVNEIPLQLIQKILEAHKIYDSRIDLGNVLIFGSEFLPQTEKEFSWMLVQTSTGNTRWVCSVSLPIKKMSNQSFCSYQLYHNLCRKSAVNKSIRIFPETLQETNSSLTNASMARVALLNSMQVGDSVKKLKKFFFFQKYVQPGDLVEVDKEMMLKIESVDGPKSLKRNIGYFIENQKSSLFQLASVPSLKFPTERKLKLNWKTLNSLSTYEEINDCTMLNRPPSFSEYCNLIQRIIEPFLIGASDWLNKPSMSVTLPTFLITGPSGSGKRFVVKCVADALGLHFMEMSCLGLLGESSKASELRIRNLFENARQVSPAVLYLTDIDVIGKGREGNLPDFRLLRFFVSELRQLQMLDSTQGSPIFLVASCQDSNKCSPDVCSVLLHKIIIRGLSDEDRTTTLLWLLEESSLTIDTPLEPIIRKMHGFRFGDINATVSAAARHPVNNFEGPSTNSTTIPTSSIEYAINLVRRWQSANMNAPTIPEVRWEDVGGLQHIINELLDTIQLPLKFPELIQNGLKRSGILLYGPPGTGKTLLAKAVATECNLHFLSVKGPELLNMYVGQSEENVRNVFEAARQASPCLIFFDELDSLAPNRGRSGDSGGVMDRVVSQLLAELDGINQSAVVFVIGATNRPDLIDPALLRPGRFDKLLFLSVNNSKEYQLSVLKALTRKFQLHPEVDLQEIVQQLPTHLTGADLYSLCSNAMLKSVERCILLLKEGNTIPDTEKMMLPLDFQNAARQLVPSVSAEDLSSYRELERRINQFPQK